jgi:hypothetical protein
VAGMWGRCFVVGFTSAGCHPLWDVHDCVCDLCDSQCAKRQVWYWCCDAHAEFNGHVAVAWISNTHGAGLCALPVGSLHWTPQADI